MNRETNEITPEYNTEASASDHASSFSGSDISEIPVLDSPGENRFKRFIRKIRQKPTSYLIYAFIIPVVLNYIIYLAMEIHPFGNGSVLVLDLNGQYVYFYEALRNAVYGQMSMIYSFCRALGGEFMGIYAYYVASPFSYLVALFPQERILDALLIIFLMKTGIAGFNFGFYLHRTSKKINKLSIITFSILYSLTTYAVIHQHNSMWIDAMMWLPLLTLSIEELIKNFKYKRFVILLALTMMSNFYIGYMVCIYVAAYFFYYYFSRNEKWLNNPHKEPHHFRRSFLRIAGASALGIGISMVVVATAYYSLQFGKNTFSTPNFTPSLRFDFMDFLTKFLPGSYDTVRPEGLPFVYCGVITLLLLPVYFLSKKFSSREKALSAAFIMFFVMSFFISTFDLIWHGFQKPNWLNYRYSFMLCFFLIVLAYRGYEEIQHAKTGTIVTTGSLWLLFICVAQKFEFHSYVERIDGTIQFDQPLKDIETVWFSAICFIAFMIILCMAIKSRSKQTISLIVCIFVCLEVFCNGICSCVEFGDDVIYSSYSSYNDFISAIRPVTDELLEEDAGFYRFEKNAHRKYCDNMALRIRGLTNSTSTLNRSTITFLHQLGYASKSHWSKYLGGTPVNDSLLGIKYVLANEKNSQTLYYENAGGSVTTYGNTEYTYYRNPYALSIAYGASDALLDFDLSDGYNPFVRLNGLYGAILGDDEAPEIFKAISFGSDGIETTNCDVSTIAGHYKYAPQSSSTDCIVSYTITVAEDGEIFFYLPSEYPREVSIRVNGKKPSDSDTFYGGESDRIVSLGTFEKGDTVKLSMTLKGDVLYVKQNVDMFYYIDMDVFEGAISRIAETQMTVSDGWTDSYLPGTLTTTKDSQLIMTTLAYDSGWKVTVDGKRVDTVEALDGVVAFTVDTAGEHEIVMKYRPTALTLGLTITVLSIILFALIMIFEKQLKAVLARVCADGNTDSSETNEGADDSDPEVDEYLLTDIPDEADDTAEPDKENSDEESED
ncbi:MAG: YfhO family protein [Eubacteriales bacterium]|nr:YfhO family protein [Eubacteriales bacterium]